MADSLNPIWKRFAYLLPAFAAMGAIFWASSIPGKNLDMPFQVKDKVMHFGAYAVIAGCWLLGLRQGWGWPTKKVAIWTTVICSLYGISDEFHQSFVPGRTPEVLDAVADGLGAATMSLLFYLYMQRAQRKVAP